MSFIRDRWFRFPEEASAKELLRQLEFDKSAAPSIEERISLINRLYQALKQPEVHMLDRIGDWLFECGTRLIPLFLISLLSLCALFLAIFLFQEPIERGIVIAKHHEASSTSWTYFGATPIATYNAESWTLEIAGKGGDGRGKLREISVTSERWRKIREGDAFP